MEVKYRLSATGKLPTKAHESDAGWDLYSAVGKFFPPGAWGLVNVGIYMELPPGTHALVLPRSGLALKHGVTVLNAPGLIDSGYRDEVKVMLINHGPNAFSVNLGDRIAQLLIRSNEEVEWLGVERLSETDRGRGGFGSSGRS